LRSRSLRRSIHARSNPPDQPPADQPKEQPDAERAWMLRRSDLLRRAAVALREKRYADARTILEPLLERDPNDPEALLMMANIRGGISAEKVPPAPQKPPQPPPENRPPAPVCPAQVGLLGPVVKEYNGASNRTLSWTGTFNPTCTL